MRAFLLVLAVLLSSCGTTPISTDFKGSNSGTVVLGLGARGTVYFSRFTLLFRKATAPAEKPAEVGEFAFRSRGVFGGEKVDYETREETGVVITANLPEGDYVLHSFSLFMNSGTYQSTLTPRVSVSIPFSVKAGAVTYLGNFQATETKGKNLFGMSVSAGAFFAVEDRAASELKIAERKGLPSGLPLVNFVPRPEQLAGPLFVTPATRDRIVKEFDLR